MVVIFGRTEIPRRSKTLECWALLAGPALTQHLSRAWFPKIFTVWIQETLQ